MYLFFFAIGFGSANSVATGYNVSRRLGEFLATLGGLSPYPHSPGFEVRTHLVLSDPDWPPGMAEDTLFPGMYTT